LAVNVEIARQPQSSGGRDSYISLYSCVIRDTVNIVTIFEQQRLGPLVDGTLTWFSLPKGDQLRVQSRLLRVFLLQLALISVVTIAGVLAASWVAESILVNQALEGEADYYWTEWEKDPNFKLPDTLNLTGYLDTVPDANRDATVPEALRGLSLGQQRVNMNGGRVIVHVSKREQHKLVLVFEDETVSNLGFYFGVVPLTLVLLLMYSLAYFAYIMSKRAVSPIARLADTIENIDLNGHDTAKLNLSGFRGPHNSETLVLAEALQHFTERTQRSIDRERNFVRYASHELRTPLAVVQGSVSSLQLANLDGAPKRALDRIDRAGRHMNDLITTMLMLARDKPSEVKLSQTSINTIVDELVAELTVVLPRREQPVQVRHDHNLFVSATVATLRIVLGNLLRNACLHGGPGEVIVSITNSTVSIQDQGDGLNAEDQRRIFEPFYRADGTSTEGHGLGLALVQKTCASAGWVLNVDSQIGVGSIFTVEFGESVSGAGNGVQ